LRGRLEGSPVAPTKFYSASGSFTVKDGGQRWNKALQGLFVFLFNLGLFVQMIIFIFGKETAGLSFVHSYFPLIRRRVIVLP